MHRRSFLTLAALGGVASMLPLAHAADWPTRPVRVVVPYPAGGPFDALMRLLGQQLTAEWKQPIVIDNKPGANEALGADAVAHADPDGYTLLLCTESAVTLNPLLFSKLTYDPRNLAPVSHIANVPLILVVPASSPARDVKSFIGYARSRSATPLNYGSGGIGNPTHLSMAKFVKDNDITMVHIPYKGGAPMVQDMLGGQLDAMMLSPSVVAPYIRSGQFKALAASGKQRVGALPDVPTFEEAGVKDVDGETMLGLFAPKGTPDAITERIAASLRTILTNEDVRSRNLEPYGFRPIATGPREFGEYLRADKDRQAAKVKLSGATLD